MNKEELNIIETVILLLDNCPKSELLLKYNMGEYLNRAEVIVKYIKDGRNSKNSL